MPQQSPLERVLAALPDAKQTKSDAWMATCPAHDDAHRSLSVGVGEKGMVLKCHAGCETSAIVERMGLRMADLFPPRSGAGVGATAVEGESNRAARRSILATYDYTDERGDLLYQAVRYNPKAFSQRRPDPEKSGAWLWNLQGVRRVLYRLPDVLATAAAGGLIYLVEGEKDADTLGRLGLVATTNAGGADKWNADYSAALTGAHVVLIPDNDEPGRKHVQRAGADLIGRAASVQVIELTNLLPKGDVSDWLKVGGTGVDLQRLTESALTWQDWSAKQAASAPPNACSGLPEIETTNRQQREISSDIFRALIAANDPPRLFVRSGQIVRIGYDEDERPRAEVADEDIIAHVVARAANFVSTSEKRGKVAVKPPAHALNDLLHAPRWPGLPPLAGVATSPVVGPDGHLVTTPGYLAGARLFYHEAQRFDLPDTTPTEESVKASVSLLLDIFLGDFPFVDQSSRANALALLLVPFVRPYIDGPTPLHLIDAPAAGTGKTLLGRMIASVFLPGGPPLSSAPVNRTGTDDDEWRKKLTSALKSGGPFCFIDNITGTLASPSLDLILTAREWTDRELGKMAMVTLPVLCTFIGTANNVTVGGDTDRRTVWIRIDSGVEQPYEREGFKIADIEEFARAERPRLLGAVLTILRAWIEAGRPKWKGTPVGSFERWSAAIGGILGVAGVAGFLGNRKEMFERLDPEREKWTDFFREWHGIHGSKRVTVSEVAGLAWNHDFIDNTERPGKTALGCLFRAKIDRVFSGFRLKNGGSRSGYTLYQVVITETGNLGFDSGLGESNGPSIPNTQEVSETNADTCKGERSEGPRGQRGTPNADEWEGLEDLDDPFVGSIDEIAAEPEGVF